MDMRKAIDATKILLEAPGLISGTEDFGLNDAGTNLHKARLLTSGNSQTLFENNKCILVITGADEGAIGLVNKANHKLYYYVRFETMKLPLTGSTVTQVELWRNIGVAALFPGSITEYVFFDVLLPKFGAVMSDELQTSDGAKFWLRILGRASHETSLKISCADLGTGTIHVFDATEPLDEWIKKMNAWGFNGSYKKKRFIISNH